MIRDYDDLTEQEQDELSHAWVKIYEGLEVYERLTGTDLTDYINDEIWDQINWQKNNQEEESEDGQI